MAQAHRRGSGVVGNTPELEFGPRYPLHAFHRAYRDSFDVEHRALLDVQLDVAVHLHRAGSRCAAITDALQVFPHAGPVDTLDFERVRQRQIALKHEAAHHVRRKARPFFIGEKRHRDGLARARARTFQRAHHFEPRQHAVVAVVESAGAHGVDMGARHDRRHILLAGVDPDDVADAVDAHPHPQRLHLRHDPVAPGLVLVRERQPANPAALEGADPAQFLQRGKQTPAVDVQSLHRDPPSAAIACDLRHAA